MQYSLSIDWTTLVAYPSDIVVDGSAGRPECSFGMGILALMVRDWSCFGGEGEGSE